jgi:protein-S-isoprenylcysteine O-methyltransferase Ste14
MASARRSAAIQSVAFLVLTGALLFGAAGRIDLWNFWIVLAIFALVFVASLALLDADLVSERLRPGGRRRPVALYLATAGMFVEFGMAGLDRGRLHWTDTVPPALVVVASILFALGNAVALWAMWVNRYFSSVVRIQGDRGQRVIDTGPYAWVRHPGYAAAFIMLPANGLALGSWIATAIALLGLPWLVWRTIGEDRMLRADLEGYEDYARRVRWRLVPGIW